MRVGAYVYASVEVDVDMFATVRVGAKRVNKGGVTCFLAERV